MRPRTEAAAGREDDGTERSPLGASFSPGTCHLTPATISMEKHGTYGHGPKCPQNEVCEQYPPLSFKRSKLVKMAVPKYGHGQATKGRSSSSSSFLASLLSSFFFSFLSCFFSCFSLWQNLIPVTKTVDVCVRSPRRRCHQRKASRSPNRRHRRQDPANLPLRELLSLCRPRSFASWSQ